jgi:hypothetical protein
MSELKWATGLGELRVRGLARVHFAVVCKVTACNLKWWAAWQIKGSKDEKQRHGRRRRGRRRRQWWRRKSSGPRPGLESQGRS